MGKPGPHSPPGPPTSLESLMEELSLETTSSQLMRRAISSPAMAALAASAGEEAGGHLDVFVANRAFSSWCGGIMTKIPAPLASACVEMGICHFLLVLRTPSGRLHSFDFGPIGGDITLRDGPNSTQTPGGLKGAPGEIREQQLEELPDGALYVGRTSHMTLDDVREYSKLQPTVYKLHQNDCRHYVNNLVRHALGVDAATVQLLRSQYADRVRNERETFAQQLQEAWENFQAATSGALSSSSTSSSGADSSGGSGSEEGAGQMPLLLEAAGAGPSPSHAVAVLNSAATSGSASEAPEQHQAQAAGAVVPRRKWFARRAVAEGAEAPPPGPLKNMGAAVVRAITTANLPPWHAPIINLGQWMTDTANWHAVRLLGNAAVGMVAAASGARLWVVAKSANLHLRLPGALAAAGAPTAGARVAAAAAASNPPHVLLLSRLSPSLQQPMSAAARAAAAAVAPVVAQLKGRMAQAVQPLAAVAHSHTFSRKQRRQQQQAEAEALRGGEGQVHQDEAEQQQQQKGRQRHRRGLLVQSRSEPHLPLLQAGWAQSVAPGAAGPLALAAAGVGALAGAPAPFSTSSTASSSSPFAVVAAASGWEHEGVSWGHVQQHGHPDEVASHAQTPPRRMFFRLPWTQPHLLGPAPAASAPEALAEDDHGMPTYHSLGSFHAPGHAASTPSMLAPGMAAVTAGAVGGAAAWTVGRSAGAGGAAMSHGGLLAVGPSSSAVTTSRRASRSASTPELASLAYFNSSGSGTQDAGLLAAPKAAVAASITAKSPLPPLLLQGTAALQGAAAAAAGAASRRQHHHHQHQAQTAGLPLGLVLGASIGSRLLGAASQLGGSIVRAAGAARQRNRRASAELSRTSPTQAAAAAASASGASAGAAAAAVAAAAAASSSGMAGGGAGRRQPPLFIASLSLPWVKPAPAAQSNGQEQVGAGAAGLAATARGRSGSSSGGALASMTLAGSGAGAAVAKAAVTAAGAAPKLPSRPSGPSVASMALVQALQQSHAARWCA